MENQNQKEYEYFEKTVKLFNENKLTRNIIRNTSKPVFDRFQDWIHNNIAEFSTRVMMNNQIDVLRRMKYGVCCTCTNIIDMYNSIDIFDLDFDITNTKWVQHQYGLTIIYKLYKINENGNKIKKLFSYDSEGHMHYYPYKENVICDECVDKKEKKVKENYLKKQMKKTKCKETESICSICIDPIIIDEKQIQLKCSHAFHPKCISEWTNRKSNCPCCRFDIVV